MKHHNQLPYLVLLIRNPKSDLTPGTPHLIDSSACLQCTCFVCIIYFSPSILSHRPETALNPKNSRRKLRKKGAEKEWFLAQREKIMAQLQDSVRCGFRAWYKRCRVWGFGFGVEGVQSSTSRFQRRLQLQIYLACSVVYHFKLLSPATAASVRVQSLGFGNTGSGRRLRAGGWSKQHNQKPKSNK